MLGLKVGAWFAGVDYLRLTSREVPGRGDYHRLYKQVAYALVAASSFGETDFKPWQWRGYYGEACAGVSYGRSGQGCILQASGWRAQDEALPQVSHDNVPRLDVQVTVWGTDDAPGVARVAAAASRAYASGAPGGRWGVTHIDGGEKGDTTYIGSRVSDSFIRIYDKWRESGQGDEYQWAWRFEVELKNAEAVAVWSAARATSPTPEWWAGVVYSRLRARGIVLPALVQAGRTPPPRAERLATSTDSRLAWLRNQVAPSVDKLLAAGVPYSLVLSSLGLADANRNE